MSDGLKRFSNRLTVFALIKAGVYSFSLGAIVFAVLLILHKREVIAQSPLISALIALGASAVAFVILFLLRRPDNRKTARIVDEEFQLGERAQTMLAYEGREGPMLEMQRLDTEQRIADIPSAALRFKRLWVSIVSLSLALALIIVGIAVPALAEDAPDIPIIDGYEKNWRIAELKQLIARVEADKFAEEGLRAGIFSDINELIAAIEATDEEPAIKAAAIQTVGSLSALLSSFNSSDALSAALLGSSDATIVAMGNAIAKLSDSGFSDALEDLVDAIDSATDATNALSIYSGKLSSSISTAEGVDNTDGLYCAIMALSNGIATILDSGSADTSGELSELCDEVCTLTSVAFLQQSDNLRISNIAISEIMRIFSITKDE
ncbi:MAG: hypothetical protein IJY24_00430, partial [Clostridia bacterium]|nr:hypothetical protein [Clostridia bacterium]